jgi:drug/metabolite transporter (DMT)-like permease
MSNDQEKRRRVVELALIVIIALIGWYLSRPHPPNGPRELLHWAFAVLAAYMLGAAAWSVITKPSRILVSLGYLMLGSSMTLSFVGDIAVPELQQRLGWYSLAALYAGLVLFWLDYRKYGFSRG